MWIRLTWLYLALILLYMAGYIHRDVSIGNIIMVKDSNGNIIGKLSDMEFAKRFDSDQSNPDLKTVSP
jgi:ABC-type siderophore export system fused ATPase/permease subunit